MNAFLWAAILFCILGPCVFCFFACRDGKATGEKAMLDAMCAFAGAIGCEVIAVVLLVAGLALKLL